MLDAETKRHIDAARQVLVGIVPDPKGQVDQITNALIYKFMDDMDQQVVTAGGDPSFFVGDLKKYSWRALMDTKLGHQEQMNLYVEAIAKFGEAPKFPVLFRDMFKRAFLPYRDPEVLSLFLKEIAFFDYANSEKLGDAYEYLLSIMGSQGDAGQFRTPRHIIDFIVEVVDPGKDDTILDPACGTAGFLISAYKHILAKHDEKDDTSGKATTKEKRMTPDELKKLPEHFTGYDISPDMVRMSQVNMYLHKFKKPRIFEYNTLASEDHWNEKYDVILANPPFMSPKGGVQPHNKFGVQSNRAEVLFVDYFISHLNPRGRAGMIVPEGIIFQSGIAYKQLRKNLLEDGLFAVVSLPSGVFNPYSGVKTSILFFDNTLAKKAKDVLFVKVTNDGFDLGAQRRSLGTEGDLPHAIAVIKMWQNILREGGNRVKIKGEKEFSLASWVLKEKIEKSSDLSLSAERYVQAQDYSNAKWPIVKLEEVVIDMKDGGTPSRSKSDYFGGGINWCVVKDIKPEIFETKETITQAGLEKSSAKIWPPDSIIISLGATIGNVGIAKVPVATKQGLSGIIVNKAKILPKFLFYILVNMKELINSFATGASIREVRPKALQELFRFPLPPLEIQKQIVAELDGYQRIIDGAKQIVENWKPVIEIDPKWGKEKIGNVIDILNGYAFKSENYVSKGIRVIRITNVQKGSIVDDNPKFYPKETNEPVKKYELFEIDLLMSLTGNVGRVGLLPKALLPAALNQRVACLRPKSSVDSIFLFWLLNRDEFERDCIKASSGVAQKNLSTIWLSKYEIPLPSIVKQQEIVNGIEVESVVIESTKRLADLTEEKMKKRIEGVWGK